MAANTHDCYNPKSSKQTPATPNRHHPSHLTAYSPRPETEMEKILSKNPPDMPRKKKHDEEQPDRRKTQRDHPHKKFYPQKQTNDDFVFFLHIPKTAGTSISSALESIFPAEKTLTHAQVNNVRKNPKEIFLNARFFHGHFTHDVYSKRLPKQPTFIITFIRDPIAHFISTFFHLKIDPTFTYTTRLSNDRELADEIHQNAKTMSIKDFLKWEASTLFNNFQTRYIVRGLSDIDHQSPDEILLPAAESMLLQLPFFGITEKMEDSVALLKEALNTSNDINIGRANRSRNKPSNYKVDEETLHEIEKRTASDRRLYTIASMALEDRIKKYTLQNKSAG